MPESQAQVRASGSTRQAIREYFDSEARNAERIQKFTLGLTDDDELPPYVYQEFPKAMYAIDGETALANGIEEERTLLNAGYYASLEQAKAAALGELEAYADDDDEADSADLSLAESPTVLHQQPRARKKQQPTSRRKAG